MLPHDRPFWPFWTLGTIGGGVHEIMLVIPTKREVLASTPPYMTHPSPPDPQGVTREGGSCMVCHTKYKEETQNIGVI